MIKLKYISILVLLLSFGTMFSQSKSGILNELSELLGSNNIAQELFYNADDKILDIDGYQINLRYSKARYEESDGESMLGFICHNCTNTLKIYDPKTKRYYESISIPMKDKENVYKAIHLINQLDNLNYKGGVKGVSLDTLLGGFSETDYNTSGDKGKVTGDPNASGYYGIRGDGSGGNYRLGNRTALNKAVPDYPCNEQGRVVVSISVDQSGRVIAAQAGKQGTTNSAPCLLNEAKAAALKTTFNADSKAPSKQVGEIIYNFSLSE